MQKRMIQGYLTNNSNIVVEVRDKTSAELKILYCAFISPKGDWLRECSQEEMGNVVWNRGLMLASDHLFVQDFFDKVLPVHAPTWEFMGSIRIEEDYSNYKPETCYNGGDYAFYTSLDVYFTTINGRPVIRGVTRYSTSAEFEYDELNGSFQTNLTDSQVLNAYADNGEDTVRFSWYSTQGYDTCYLEQISQVYKLEDIYNLTSKVIEKDEVDDIIEREYVSPDRAHVIANLIDAGASFAPAPRNQRRG